MPDNLAPRLARIPLFSCLPARALRRVASVVEIQEYRAGQPIVKEGSYSRYFYVMLDGSAKITVRGRMRDQIGPGDFFGELAILNRSNRSATVTPVEPSSVAAIDARDFTALVEEEPKIALYLLNALARRFEWLTRRPAGELK